MVINMSEKIKQLREKTNLTQSELARKLNVTRACVNAWEMGISTPSTYFIVELANMFNITTDFLLGRDEKEYINITTLHPLQKTAIYALMASYSV